MKTDQRIYFQLASRKPIKEAISKLWTVPVDHVHRSHENRSKNPFPNFGQFL
jgi:hypothetical protein